MGIGANRPLECAGKHAAAQSVITHVPNAAGRCVGRPPALAHCKRRDKILKAACTVLSAHGYHAASMDKVAHESGMSKKTLYQIFPSKQGLFEALLDERLFRAANAGNFVDGTLEEQLSSRLIEVAKVILRDDQISLMRAIISDVSRSDDMRQILNNMLELSREHSAILIWMAEQAKSGAIVVDDAFEATRYIFGMTVGEMMLKSLLGCSLNHGPEQRDAFIRKAVRIFLRGLAANAAEA
jgi:AcrR family transcriptional regulator